MTPKRNRKGETMSKPTQEQVDKALNHCADLSDAGENPWPGMTFADGVDAAIRWMQGIGEYPLEE